MENKTKKSDEAGNLHKPPVRRSKPPVCEYCENECAEDNSPVERINFMIPFTKIEIRVWDWGKKHYHEMCNDCLIENSQSERKGMEEAFDYEREESFAKGYNEGRRDGR